ncbi:MAG TPA: glycoside hydrolase family 3 N-terminal domain-containing protein, partial [Treponemataceae bacterium]|nr:glycoside hydrolase family 3 N-terminal domain-containing protein [Treponemataceae bacterium]
MKSIRHKTLAIRCLCAVFFFTIVASCAKAETKETVSAPAADTVVPAVTPEFASAKFRDPSAPVEERVEDLLARMTVDEKIGQMTQVVFYKLRDGEMKTFAFGSALSGGGGSPWGNNTIPAWCDMVDGLQKEALSTRLGIPMLYGTDSVHGHNNLLNATIFPHNIGIGAAGDPDLAERIGKAAALETAATGVPWTFAPCVAVARDPRWGRFYESYGQDSALVTRLSSAFIRGFQSADTGAAKSIVTAKHFLGDGNTVWGSSRTGNYFIDQGNMIKDEKFIRETLLPP